MASGCPDRLQAAGVAMTTPVPCRSFARAVLSATLHPVTDGQLCLSVLHVHVCGFLVTTLSCSTFTSHVFCQSRARMTEPGIISYHAWAMGFDTMLHC